MKLWKILGLAGLAGVTATGVVIARDERRRAQLTPQQVRDRLHQRLAEIEQGSDAPGEGASVDQGPPAANDA